MEAEPVLSLAGVVKDYRGWRGRFRALDGVDLRIMPGRVVGLLGPNGAGKTTLLKLILGLLRVTAGTVRIFGAPCAGLAEKERIGFLPEESYLYPFLTVRETVEFAAGMYRNRPGAARVDAVLAAVGMSGSGERRISECSKGMARRTALAQCLVHDPELVLLDEPTSGFDPVGINDMKQIVRRLKAEGRTVLVCSHQLAIVEETCDDIVVLHRGRVLAQGPLEELLADEVGEALLVPSAERERVLAWLAQEGIGCRRAPSRSLEAFFIRTLERCPAAR